MLTNVHAENLTHYFTAYESESGLRSSFGAQLEEAWMYQVRQYAYPGASPKIPRENAQPDYGPRQLRRISAMRDVRRRLIAMPGVLVTVLFLVHGDQPNPLPELGEFGPLARLTRTGSRTDLRALALGSWHPAMGGTGEEYDARRHDTMMQIKAEARLMYRAACDIYVNS